MRSFFDQQDVDGVLGAVLVDDGSTDGTADAVRTFFPAVEVVTGNGSLYWAGGMALAQWQAEQALPDYLLWLNDDVVLDPGAVAHLLDTARAAGRGAIIAGALRDPVTGATTYTGLRRRGRRPRGFAPVEPDGRPTVIDAFNGNVVLVPHIAYGTVGTVDPALRHGYADHDYGLRAAALGRSSVLAGRTVGQCSRNSLDGSWQDLRLSRRERLRRLVSVKEMPVVPHVIFTRRHGGWRWPFYVAAGYGKAVATVLFVRRQD